MYYDPRCPKLGFRIISNKNENSKIKYYNK